MLRNIEVQERTPRQPLNAVPTASIHSPYWHTRMPLFDFYEAGEPLELVAEMGNGYSVR